MNIDDIAKIGNDFSIPSFNMFPTISDILAKIEKSINEYINNDIFEEMKQVHQSYKKWGNYGWTFIPSVVLGFYHTSPDSLEDADSKALAQLTKDEFGNLLKLLRVKNINIDDLDEAVYCFEHKKYKACAMILFSMIDFLFINPQPANPQPDREKGEHSRFIGSRAFSDAKTEIERHGMLTPQHYNTYPCLFQFYKNTEDFMREPPDIINRNFIAHGMSKRSVSYIDCIKLFLALYNTSVLLNFQNVVLDMRKGSGHTV